MSNLVKRLSGLIQKNQKDKIHMMKVDSLVFDKDFQSLYPQEPEKVDSIASSMKAGYDFSFPVIVLSKDGKTVLDGHSRTLAARKAGLKEVPVIEKDFQSKDEALLYIESLQLGRRNLSEADKMKHFEHMKTLKEKLKAEGKDVSAYTDEKLASQLQVSVRQVQKFNEVESKATAEQLEAIRNGEKSVNQIHTEIKQAQDLSRKSPVTAKPKVETSEKLIEKADETPVVKPLQTPAKIQPSIVETNPLKDAIEKVLSVAKIKLDESQAAELSKLLDLISKD